MLCENFRGEQSQNPGRFATEETSNDSQESKARDGWKQKTNQTKEIQT